MANPKRKFPSIDYVEMFEEWVSREIVSRNAWSFPLDKCHVWCEGELGFSTEVYKAFCEKWSVAPRLQAQLHGCKESGGDGFVRGGKNTDRDMSEVTSEGTCKQAVTHE